MRNESDVTGIQYEEEDCVFFRNWLQASKYMQWGAKLIDIFPSRDDKFVYVFSKEDHNKYKTKWGSTKHELFGGDEA